MERTWERLDEVESVAGSTRRMEGRTRGSETRTMCQKPRQKITQKKTIGGGLRSRIVSIQPTHDDDEERRTDRMMNEKTTLITTLRTSISSLKSSQSLARSPSTNR